MFFLLLFACVQLIQTPPSHAQKDWKVYTTEFVDELMKTQKAGGNIFVSAIQDESRRQIYYPFMETVQKTIVITLREKGFVVNSNPVNADRYVMSTFLEQPERLFFKRIHSGCEKWRCS